MAPAKTKFRLCFVSFGVVVTKFHPPASFHWGRMKPGGFKPKVRTTKLAISAANYHDDGATKLAKLTSSMHSIYCTNQIITHESMPHGPTKLQQGTVY